MELPKQINNKSERLVDDLKARLSTESRVSIAAASFSIYAFEALKKELEKVKELRFIFTSPTFVSDKKKRRRSESFTSRSSTVSETSMVRSLNGRNVDVEEAMEEDPFEDNEMKW